jgi:phosphoglycolate phosphatase
MTDLRILLWDIDGTLIRSARAGAFKEYTIPVLESVFGTAGRLSEMTVSGMTDWQIVLEALASAGLTREQIRERVVELRERYVAELERVSSLQHEEPLFELLPGVREVLEAADAHPRYMSALLTGNVEPAARLKMRLVGLSEFFPLPGAFGDDSHDRRDLPAIARRRISRHLGVKLLPEQLVVIGDTPNDIACANAIGARCLAVATGGATLGDLERHRPRWAVRDLTAIRAAETCG